MKTRLIDADKLVDSLRASMNHGRETFPVDLIVEAIDEQPTTKYIEQISRDDIDVDQHIIIWHFRRIKLCRNNAGIFHPRTPGILVITVIEKIITVITRLKMGYFNFPDSANYGIK